MQGLAKLSGSGADGSRTGEVALEGMEVDSAAEMRAMRFEEAEVAVQGDFGEVSCCTEDCGGVTTVKLIEEGVGAGVIMGNVRTTGGVLGVEVVGTGVCGAVAVWVLKLVA